MSTAGRDRAIFDRVTPSPLVRHLFRGAIALTTLAAVASCGARTGLFGPEPSDTIVDASVVDTSLDASIDARDADVLVDAPADVIEEPVGCVPGTFALTLATPQLMFVFDRSGSMEYELTSNNPAPPGTPSRWSVLHDALAQTMTPFSNQIAMGARFFPVRNANAYDPVAACLQDSQGHAIAPGLGKANAILDVFAQTSPVGGTPTAVAVALAAQQISVGRAVGRAMVVATDGVPNCNASLDHTTCTCTSLDPLACAASTSGGTNCLDDVRTVQTISDIFGTKKIPVYVVGIGATGTFANTLDAMAMAGGRPRSGSPKYYAADTPAEMTEAFTIVRDSVAKCSYITPSSPEDPDDISVVVGGKEIDRDPSHGNGWDWIDQAFGHLQLFGEACTLASASNVSGTVSCDRDE